MKKILIILLVVLGWNCSNDESVNISDVETGVFVDERDSVQYRYITVGNQMWMAENLRHKLVGGAFDGCWTWNETLPALSVQELVDLGDSYVMNGKMSWDVLDEIYDLAGDKNLTYKDIIEQLGDKLPEEFLADFYKTNPNEQFLANYGYLYDYEAALKAVPEGWRLPTDKDWQLLEQHLGMSAHEAAILNEWRGDKQGELLKQSGEGLNFDAKLCGGKVFGTGVYTNVYTNADLNAYFWTSTAYADTDSTRVAIVRGVGKYQTGVLRFTSRLDNTAFSVRCVKDK